MIEKHSITCYVALFNIYSVWHASSGRKWGGHLSDSANIASGVDIRQAQYHVQLKLLQDTAPLLASFIMKLPFDVAVPSDVCCLISDLLDLALIPFKQPSPSSPPPTAETGLSFFRRQVPLAWTHRMFQWVLNGQRRESIDEQYQLANKRTN